MKELYEFIRERETKQRGYEVGEFNINNSNNAFKKNIEKFVHTHSLSKEKHVLK